ncbi:error-prone DNA polymerase [Ancylobacter pratisalsi]|uniref:Error-prone DNA polymerase n=1 Tax=Ancylobacter pratisalsi TaxID=1745854 RepID=A0A6P1YRK2_9HYPH|nr:error-prone DNA polymerase [Ancylobacter pratisalsi]QIB34364.1 DNA polymerase III subunit alpha [Ancylobacter pratisalsi]
MSFFAEMVVASNFSFLRGASSAQALVTQALALGHAGIGIADRNTVAGVVRAHAALERAREIHAEAHAECLAECRVATGQTPDPLAARPALIEDDPLAQVARARGREAAARGDGPALDFRLAVGARLVFADGTPDIIAHAQDRDGWGRLTRLLTAGNLRAGIKGECHLRIEDLLADARGLLLILMPSRHLPAGAGRKPEGKVSAGEGLLAATLEELGAAAPGALWLGAAMTRRGDDRARLARLKVLSRRAGVPLIATNDVLYHHPDQRDLQDVLSCIREGTTLEAAGRRLEANAERHLKPPAEMARLFHDAPEAVEQARDFLARIDFSLGELKYEYPEEPVPPGHTPQGWLETMTWRRAAIRYPDGVPAKVERQLHAELKLIAELGYAPYFLTIRDIVDFAERNAILCQGRGSAANSAVCYVLGITSVDPATSELLFARFISKERREPPDIDVDFEHERREEVIQYIYERYGRHRAGIAATVISYRPRSAIRDVGKVLGLTEDVTARLAGTVWGSWGDAIQDRQAMEAGLDPGNRVIARAIGLASRLLGFPRHLSQHVGGFVLTRGRLDEMVPIGLAAMENRTFIEWDKDDIDTLGLLKVDVLALGMLTCIRKAFDLIAAHEGEAYTLAEVPEEQSDVYDMLCRGDSIGVFQVESRAQINMLPRMKPRCLYDLVIQVAIVRPGPIQGNMVHPYLRRRDRLEKESYPAPAPPHDPNELREVLSRTMGVPLFQEQAMKLAMVAAEFSEVEANKLRRAMATFRHVGTIGQFQHLLVERMSARGYDPAFAARCFEQIKGFGEYGFPESHAASFARLVYISAFIKCRHPAAFACALLNAQPMGFYAPAQIVRDAREHGVEVRAADVNHSLYDNTLERRPDGGLALRLGFRQIDGMSREAAERLARTRGAGFADVETLARHTRLPVAVLTRLAEADAFRSIGLDRRAAAWAVRRLPDDAPLPLFAAADARELGADADAHLPLMALPEQIAVDYQTTRLSLKGHPMGMLRARFTAERVLSSAQLGAARDGAFVRVAGIVLVRQRPGKGNAIFMTLEDETGIVNVLLWARQFERFRAQVMGARLAVVEGRVQKSKEGVIHVMGERVHDRSGELARLFEEDTLDRMPDRAAEAEGRAGGDYLPPPQVDPGRDERETRRIKAPSQEAPREALPGRGTPRHGHPRQVRVLPKSRDFH